MTKLNIQLACQNLKQGNIIAYPTEAVWGIGCDPYNEAAVSNLLCLKNRPVSKGLILIGASIDQFEPLVRRLRTEQRDTLGSSWPGHITWLVPDPDQLIPEWIKGRHQSVAIRVSGHPVVQELCTGFAGPIVSTSANEAGEKEIRSRLILEDKFADKIACIVDGDLGHAAKPSEMRDLLSGRVIR
ncbi:MAG: tRNA threonylcarbamoyladenosine biosynthesis protein RimN [SAR86 cluster bacterium]|uniref:Threonylcarbamoyl-AMP synthase n=1 Tax=SAR86 cluster bacterium TaxID=2030880 RepID=A0A2A4WWM2_9GAMM|nr:MAG: tRNA threonylcarbamoyladenosine biosynthesis protein RimN [SAR86 cluster bacterium]